jgi:GT2 family glycosyltransferase
VSPADGAVGASAGVAPESTEVTTRPAADVTVVVATHRVERYDQLLACLESLTRQTRRPREVIVVVDGCAEAAARLAERAGPETVIALPTNRGLSAVRNIGAARAGTGWVAFLDDDAVAEPGWLEELISACDGLHTAGSGGWSAPLFASGRTPGWFPEELFWTVGCSYRGMPDRTTVVRNVFGGCALLRRDLFALIGGFDETLGRRGLDFGGGEEADFCLRATAADASVIFAHAPRAVIHHRVPADRATVRYLLARCYSDGVSKGRIARSGRALSSEKSFVLAVPKGVWRHLRDRRPAAALVLLAGVAAAAVGYLRVRLGLQRSGATAPEPTAGAAR